MRLVGVLWKTVLLVSLLVGAGSAYLMSRHLVGSLTNATPGPASGPASVDGLLSGLADSIDQVAQGAGAGSGSPLAQGAAQLRSIQQGIGGTQKGFDKVESSLDGVLGGHKPTKPGAKSQAQPPDIAGLDLPGGRAATPEAPKQAGVSLKPVPRPASPPTAPKPGGGTETHRPTRIE